MAWATSAELLSWTADVLKVAEADLPALWTANAARSIESAYQNLLGVLSATGYSGDQLADSDQAEEWNLQQGLYEMAGFGGGFGDYNQEALSRFNVVEDIRNQWKEGLFALTNGGSPIKPDNTSEVGGIRFGTTSIGPTAAQVRCRFYRGDPWGRWW